MPTASGEAYIRQFDEKDDCCKPLESKKSLYISQASVYHKCEVKNGGTNTNPVRYLDDSANSACRDLKRS